MLISILLPSLESARTAKNASHQEHRVASLVYAPMPGLGDTAQFRQDPTNPTFIGAYEWGGKSGIGQPTMWRAGPIR